MRIIAIALSALLTVACGASVAPDVDIAAAVPRGVSSAVTIDQTNIGSAARDAGTDDAAPDAAPALHADWGCNPCQRLRECCMAAWGDACEIIDRNFSVSWCEGRYGEFVQCAAGCEQLDCSIVRARACMPLGR
jgi:hypothetical protein